MIKSLCSLQSEEMNSKVFICNKCFVYFKRFTSLKLLQKPSTDKWIFRIKYLKNCSSKDQKEIPDEAIFQEAPQATRPCA